MESKVFRHHDLARLQDDGTLDGILKLAHVPRPGVRREHLHGLWRNLHHRFFGFLAIFFQKGPGELRDFLGALAQWRKRQIDDVQSEEEVGAEGAGLDRLLQVPVGRRNHPDVDLDRLCAADTVELAVLEEAQQLRLKAGPHVPDLVQKDRPAVGHFHLPALLRGRARKGALLMAE